jgi:hypothetical protein
MNQPSVSPAADTRNIFQHPKYFSYILSSSNALIRMKEHILQLSYTVLNYLTVHYVIYGAGIADSV